ncbi:alpha/beta fold hydrolase [Kaarinaea lacus]
MNHIPLHYRDYPCPGTGGTPVVLLHGLLGSSSNWHSIARQLSENYPVLVPDLRNHGQSPHGEPMDYQAMCDDLTGLLEDLGYGEVILVGHSMGGKLAMEFALQYPQRVKILVIVDTAPVRYSYDFADIFAGLRAVKVSQVKQRGDADRQMAEHISESAIRQFLLQNLVRSDKGWQWRIDLGLLQAAIPSIQAPPPSLENGRYNGPVLVIHGEMSDYVQDSSHALFRQHFPAVVFNGIADAGHWVYAEQPLAFMKALKDFLEKRLP